MSLQFNCTACGGSLTLRAEGVSQSLVCSYCGTVLDALDPRHQILARHRAKVKSKMAIPIGTRGTLRGETLEVIGYQERSVKFSEIIYSWSEYLLWNPFKGYRWLIESDGHWLLMRSLNDDPQELA